MSELLIYTMYGSGKCAYLSTIKDGCTRQITSYVLSESLELPIVIDTIHLLIANEAYTISKDAYLHSYQGIHYTSAKFQKLINSKGLIQSMSRKGNCCDDAPQESFWGYMKDKLNLNQCETFEQLNYEIDKYMEYYNNEGYQCDLMKMTPNKYYVYLTTGIFHIKKAT